MTQQEARLQALSFCAAFLVAFIGTVHEIYGPSLFPWAPAWFGPFFWHAIGVLAISAGALAMAGTLQMIRIPLVAGGIFIAGFGIGAVILVACLHQQFHYFGTWVAIAGFTLAASQHRLRQLRVPG